MYTKIGCHRDFANWQATKKILFCTTPRLCVVLTHSLLILSHSQTDHKTHIHGHNCLPYPGIPHFPVSHIQPFAMLKLTTFLTSKDLGEKASSPHYTDARLKDEDMGGANIMALALR